jgi:DNA invertase Pin-like site-specific DNA recombinase
MRTSQVLPNFYLGDIMSKTKAIAIARQSRGDEASKSIPEQVARIEDYAKREGLALVRVLEEQDVSGGKPLAKRAGLLEAVEAIERGEATVLLVAYFDRLVRSLKVQAEVTERVEAAGGRIFALDVGDVSNASAGSWLSASMLGLVAEYHRKTTSDRVKSAHARLRSEGKWTGGRVGFGRAVVDGVVVRDESLSPFILAAFERRANGDSEEAVRKYLAEATGRTIRSLIVVTRLLRDETVVSDGVVPLALFRRVRDLQTKRGPRAASERLLARLAVLRCAECGARMVVHGSGPSEKYPKRVQTYRCGGQNCMAKASVSCHIAEATVLDALAKALVGVHGKSGGAVEPAPANYDAAQERLASATRRLAILGDEDEAVAVLAELRERRDEALAALEDARAVAGTTWSVSSEFVGVPGDPDFSETPSFEGMNRDDLRSLIRSVVKSATVTKGRVGDRIAVEVAEAFDVSKVLDAAAADLAEVLAISRAEDSLTPRAQAFADRIAEAV